MGPNLKVVPFALTKPKTVPAVNAEEAAADAVTSVAAAVAEVVVAVEDIVTAVTVEIAVAEVVATAEIAVVIAASDALSCDRPRTVQLFFFAFEFRPLDDADSFGPFVVPSNHGLKAFRLGFGQVV